LRFFFVEFHAKERTERTGLSAQMPSLGVYFGERKVDEKGSRCFVRRSRNRHDYSRHTDTG